MDHTKGRFPTDENTEVVMEWSCH